MNAQGRKAGSRGLVTLWTVFISAATVVQLLFKKAGGDLEPAASVAAFAQLAIGSIWVWASVLCYIGVFLLWMRILHRMDLAQAFPMTGLTYMTVPASAAFLFHESIDWTRGLGIGIILLGVIVLGSEA